METTFQTSAQLNYTTIIAKPSLFAKFFAWCDGQETYRFGWLGAIIAIHGCVLTPLALFAIVFSGTSMVLFVTAIIAMGIALVTNLAAMPTKITLPVFFLSALIDFVVIAICLTSGFSLASAGM